MDRINGQENLYVGGIFGLNTTNRLEANKITHVLSVIRYSLGGTDGGLAVNAKRVDWSQYEHLSIDIDDVEDEDMLVHLPRMVRFIDRGLHGNNNDNNNNKAAAGGGSGAVLVHCAMGKSRSVTAVMAYLLWKHPQRFGRSAPGTTAAQAVAAALAWVRQTRAGAGPNDGFLDQLRMWWDMGCPAADGDDAVERLPAYARWAYRREVELAARIGRAPDRLRFEDEETHAGQGGALHVRCKKCRRVLATNPFVAEHGGGKTAAVSAPCPHLFIEPLSWMRPTLELGALDGRLVCPGARCGATVGRYAWQGFQCSCHEWVCPAFSLQRSKVDEVIVAAPSSTGPEDAAAAARERLRALGIRLPPAAPYAGSPAGGGSGGRKENRENL